MAAPPAPEATPGRAGDPDTEVEAGAQLGSAGAARSAIEGEPETETEAVAEASGPAAQAVPDFAQIGVPVPPPVPVTAPVPEDVPTSGREDETQEIPRYQEERTEEVPVVRETGSTTPEQDLTDQADKRGRWWVVDSSITEIFPDREDR